jgi:hypothetical protein
MKLWLKWWSIVRLLRPAFSRQRTFLWFCTALVAITIRNDLAGVTSYIRALALFPDYYTNILKMFHSPGIKLGKLAALWTSIVLKVFPGIVRVKGRPVFLGDGIKRAKEGKKMPAVKSLHQGSESNSKPAFIMGHSCQALGVLTKVAGYVFAVPLICRIHEGIVFSNRDKRTLMDKMLNMLSDLLVSTLIYLVLDAYYGTRKMVVGLVAQGNHLVCRVKTTVAAHYPAQPIQQKKRGRPKKYGEKVRLAELFQTAEFVAAPSPVCGECNVEVMYYTIDLLWQPVDRLVRFVLVKHPTRGNIIFMTTDLLLSGLDVLELYGLRFKIEVSFKQAVHTIGTSAYHFWMKEMTPLKRRSGDQHLHKKNKGIPPRSNSKDARLPCTYPAWCHSSGDDAISFNAGSQRGLEFVWIMASNNSA